MAQKSSPPQQNRVDVREGQLALRLQLLPESLQNNVVNSLESCGRGDDEESGKAYADPTAIVGRLAHG